MRGGVIFFQLVTKLQLGDANVPEALLRERATRRRWSAWHTRSVEAELRRQVRAQAGAWARVFFPFGTPDDRAGFPGLFLGVVVMQRGDWDFFWALLSCNGAIGIFLGRCGHATG